MASIQRLCQVVRSTGGATGKRFLASSSFSINETSVAEEEIASNEIPSQVRPNKVNNVLNNTASKQFLDSISSDHITFAYIPSPELRSQEQIKKEISKLLNTQQYESLLNILLKLTSKHKEDVGSWQKILSSRDFAYYVRCIIEKQIKLIRQVAEYRLAERKGYLVESKLKESKVLRDGIRQLYANLLYPESNEHLYSKNNRTKNFQLQFLNESLFKPSVFDYENLIMLELYNAKLDLASKWILRFEEQYPRGEYLKHMTLTLWNLKLKVYCGGSSFLWKIPDNEISFNKKNSRQSTFFSEKNWILVFNDFLKSQKLFGNGNGILNNEFNETLIYSIGHSGNIDYLTKYIENVWGIGSNGNLIPNFKLPNSNDSIYPNINILKAIVTSLSYNNEFFKSMVYVNKFQEIYKLDLSGLKAKNLWENIFKWSELNTRFDKERALTHFIKQNSNSILASSKKNFITLKEAQQSVDFNYEGYLNYINDLQSKRNNTLSQLWNLYTETQRFFSPEPYKIYFEHLNSLDDVTDEYFNLLTILMKHYHQYNVSSRSFNKVHLNVNDTDKTIYGLYERVIQKLIDLKGFSGYTGQIQLIIDNWSLNDEMLLNLNKWISSQFPIYQDHLNTKRLEIMAQQRSEKEDDDDELLGIMS